MGTNELLLALEAKITAHIALLHATAAELRIGTDEKAGGIHPRHAANRLEKAAREFLTLPIVQ